VKAVARRTDPWTSWAAARSIGMEQLRRSQQQVLTLVRGYGPLTLEELERVAYDYDVRQSSSGLRTRLSELVSLGYVQNSGRTRKTRSGRNAIVWELASLAGEGNGTAADRPSPASESPLSEGEVGTRKGDGDHGSLSESGTQNHAPTKAPVPPGLVRADTTKAADPTSVSSGVPLELFPSTRRAYS
jgi:hypothetical protein